MGGTAELLGEAAHHGKAQASAMSSCLGCKERLESLGSNLLAHAWAVVLNFQAGVDAGFEIEFISLGDILCRGSQADALLRGLLSHGISGIDYQI